MKTTIKNYIFYIIIIYFIAMFFIYPTNISTSVMGALNLCANIVIPSLFPFFVLSALFIKSGLCEKIGNFLSPVLVPLFNLNSACCIVFILSLISGYPAGGINAITLYKQNSCTKQECERLLAFCNNCGPAFIITAIGSIMLNNYFVGIILYVIHIISALLIGIIFARFYKKNSNSRHINIQNHQLKILDTIIDSIKNSLSTILEVCAIIVTFCAVISLFDSSGILDFLCEGLKNIFNLPSNALKALIIGLLELTNGAHLITLCKINPVSMLVILSILIGFGGFCVHIQLLSHIKESGLSPKLYFIGKTLHAAISAVITFGVSKFLYKTTEVFSIKMPLSYSAFSVFLTSIIIFLSLILVLIFISFVIFKKIRRKI